MFLKLIHVVAHLSSLSLFISEYYTIVWVYIPRFIIHSPIHLSMNIWIISGFAIMSKAGMNIHVQVFICFPVS